MHRRVLKNAISVVAVIAAATAAFANGTSAAPFVTPAASVVQIATAPVYAADFVSTAAFGVAMNDLGDVTGASYPNPGCGSFCLPTLETVVWRHGQRIILPTVPGLTEITVRSINAQGWVAGFASVAGTTTTHAVLWKPNGAAYDALDLGVLPGTTSSEAAGIDNQGRVVGWSTTRTFPPNGHPFMWSESTGMVDLSAQGFPNEQPLAVSPAGTVATPGYWYRLGDRASAVAMPAPPQGFYPPGTYPTTINDAGDQGRFLAATSAQNLIYLFRFHHDGTWQQISLAGNRSLSTYGVGSINSAGDVTATVLGNAVIAFGPAGLTQPLAPLLSSAYSGGAITAAGPINSAGQILARVMIGRSARLMRLAPADPCTVSCIRVSTLTIKGTFVQDPSDPGHCTQSGKAYNNVSVKLTTTNETGAKLSGVLVSGRFLDDYWTNTPVSGTTNRRGIVSFANKGPCGVGAVAFLADSATKGTRLLDRTVGILAGSVIPQ